VGKNYSSIATISLLVAGTGFVASLPWQSTLGGGIIHAATEAALVGGVADWYAVTALFRHPLGQKWIPHTAIVPENRDKIIAGIVDMVQNQWLTKEIIREKIKNVQIINLLSPYLNGPETKKYLTSFLVEFIDKAIADLDQKMIAGYLNDILKKEGKKLFLSPYLARLLEWVQKKAYDKHFFAFFYPEIQKMAYSPKLIPLLTEAITKGVNGFLNGHAGGMMSQLLAPLLKNLNYEDFAHSLQKMLIQFLDEQTDEYREKFSQFLLSFLEKLQNDEQLQQLVENWKNNFLEKVDLTDALSSIISSWKKSNFLNGSVLGDFMNKIIDKELDKLMQDNTKTDKVESWIKEQIYKLIEEKHPAIGRLVKDNLEKLSKEDFVEVIEERVGSDLQWIRVNGAVVGGMIGIILHLFKLFIL